MAVEIRPARDDELDRVHDVVALSFNGDRSAEGRQKYIHIERLANPTVLLEDGEIVAALRVYDFTTRMNGAEIPLGGVSSVSCYPEHRRKGYVGRLLVDALTGMREKGQALSALYTPHPSLYRKFGYMTAASNLKYTWHPKRVHPYTKQRPSGKAVRVSEDGWQMLEPVYQRFAARRTGAMRRTEAWWREGVFRHMYDDGRNLRDVAVWYGSAGKAEGYAAYRNERIPGGKSVLTVAEFIALTSDAYVGLLRYVLSHDLNDEVVWYGPIEDPLAYAVADSEQIKREFVDDYMLRVVDVATAIAARPAAAGAPDGAFTVAIADESCPWNAGAWRIENSGGSLSATKASRSPDLSMEAATFAALYNGFMRASEAVRSGIAEGTDAAAALLADRVLASDIPPRGSDFF